jgi:predicted Zn finger-like uncharacterized protein
MPISVSCPACETLLRVSDELAGRKVKCPQCGGLVQIVDEEDLPSEEEERPRRARRARRESADADDEEPRLRRKKKKKVKGGHGLLFALFGGGAALAALVVVLVIVLTRAGDGQRGAPGAPPPGNVGGQGAVARPFFDKRKTVPAGLEWNVEIIARKAGPISYRVTSQGPISVLLLADQSYKALQNKNKQGMRKEDVLVDVVSPAPTYEGRGTLSPGSFHFIIENQSGMQVEMHLECFAN